MVPNTVAEVLSKDGGFLRFERQEALHGYLKMSTLEKRTMPSREALVSPRQSCTFSPRR